jgi:hypothetical protein
VPEVSDTEEFASRGREIPEDDRQAHEWFALEHGFFWAPCVLCGREWGGHEWRDIDGKPSQVHLNPDEPTTGTGICPQCTRDGKGERLPGIVCFCAECASWRERRGPGG